MSFPITINRPRPDDKSFITVHLPVRLLTAGSLAKVDSPERMTSDARQIAERIDALPGIDDLSVYRHAIYFVVALAFDPEQVIVDALAVIRDVTGLEVDGQ